MLAVDDDSMWRLSAINELGGYQNHGTSNVTMDRNDIPTHPVRSPSECLNVKRTLRRVRRRGLTSPGTCYWAEIVSPTRRVNGNGKFLFEKSFPNVPHKCAPTNETRLVKGFGDKTQQQPLKTARRLRRTTYSSGLCDRWGKRPAVTGRHRRRRRERARRYFSGSFDSHTSPMRAHIVVGR